MRSLLPMPHDLHMFRVMVTLASCLYDGYRHGMGNIPKTRDGTRLTPYPRSLITGNWNPHSLGISPTLDGGPNILNNINFKFHT
jgi:hypothetical protein